MNVLEMRAEIVEMVTETHDERKMTRFYEAIHDAAEEDDNADGWNDLTPEQQKKLEFAVAQSYDPTQSVSYEDGLKMIDKWLTR